MEQLKELAKELGQPGADKLWQEAQRRNLQLTRKEVSAYVRSLGSRQVFRDRPKYEGKITATEINDRWAADLIDYNARPSADPKDKNQPFQYVLIVQDIFSRVIFTKALKFKDQETVTEAFKEIVRNAGVPDHVDTDHGNEFKGAFDDFLREKRIYHSVADIRNKNARGTLDAAIRTIRQQIGRMQTSENRRDWAEILPGATQAHNRTVHSSLIGRAPAEVYGNDDLTFNLRERAAKDIQKNTRIIEKRGERLQNLGAFRNELVQKNKFERAYQPRYGDKVHRVAIVKGGTVVDETGKEFPTRHVLPVRPESTAVSTEGLHGGSARIDRVRLQSLEPYRARITAFVALGGKTENEVVRFMKELDGLEALTNAGFRFRNMLQLLGFSTGAGKGSSTHIVTRLDQPAGASEAAPAAPRRLVGKQALAPPPAVATRRRLVGKQRPP